MADADLTYGEQIRLHRERLGLTQHELADRLGVNMRTVTRWEDGEAEPHWIWIDRIKQMQKEEHNVTDVQGS